jgi:hypothetical protein
MAQRSKTRIVFWGFRLIALTVTSVLAYRAFKAEGYIGLTGILFSVVLGSLLSYPRRQGEKLAAENMKKAGLQLDREEALPACKAIDNRSQEI